MVEILLLAVKIEREGQENNISDISELSDVKCFTTPEFAKALSGGGSTPTALRPGLRNHRLVIRGPPEHVGTIKDVTLPKSRVRAQTSWRATGERAKARSLRCLKQGQTILPSIHANLTSSCSMAEPKRLYGPGAPNSGIQIEAVTQSEARFLPSAKPSSHVSVLLYPPVVRVGSLWASCLD